MVDSTERRSGTETLPAKTEAITALVSRICGSPLFARAQKLQQFLRYITEHSLAGNVYQMTESKIGVEVFKRKDSYSPGEDNIVRTYARTLRKRLEEYFATDGVNEPYVLSIPRGSYVLEWYERSAESEGEASGHVAAVVTRLAEVPVSRAVAASRGGFAGRAGGGLLLVAFLGATLLAYRAGQRSPREPESTPNVHRFWTAVLQGRDTVIVPSDTGLTVTLGLIQQDVSPQDYVTNEHLKVLHDKFPQLERWDRPIAHRYSDFVDVLAIHQFDHIPEINRLNPLVRYVRDLKADEIEKGNTLLLGGSNSNPWVQLFDRDLNFHLQFLPAERTFKVENRHPQGEELAEYPYGPYTLNFDAYGLVAVVPNVTHTGNVVVLEGVTNSGLQAAFSILADETQLAEINRKVLRTDGTLIPFEMLLKTPGVGGNSTRIQVLGFRTHR